jgi:hypothetical protein
VDTEKSKKFGTGRQREKNLKIWNRRA